jgi:hypothetical protein
LSEPAGGERGGLSEGLRAAIERTLAPADVRDRAGELLDEVARLGQETGAALARRGRDARDAVTRRVEEIRPASETDLDRLGARLDEIERRVAVLEENTQPQVEG